MKLSDTTLTILRNFSRINGNLHIPKGNIIRTMQVSKGCLAQATVPEVFDNDVSIYSLPQLLAMISLYGDPEFELNDDHMVIISDSGVERTIYRYAAKDILTLPPDKDLSLDPDANVTFELTGEHVKKIMRASGVLRNMELALRCRDGNLEAAVINIDNKLTNEFKIALGTADKEFNIIINLNNIHPMEISYNVIIDPRCIVQFDGDINGVPLTYWIPGTEDSTHEDAAE